MTFQTFDAVTRPADGPPRLAALREKMAEAGLAGWLVPRADAHQGEYVAPHDARLAWLTGFSGSAGFAAILHDQAGVFIDGRYRVQVRAEVDGAHFTPVPWPETRLEDWLVAHLPEGGRVGFDPWLHTEAEITRLETRLASAGITLVPHANLVDQIWTDQPAPPAAPACAHPDALAGRTSAEKRAELAADLRARGLSAAVLTLADSVSWLLNIRGADIARNPVVLAFAILHDTGRLSLFTAPEKISEDLRAHLGPEITLRPVSAFGPALRSLGGPVLVAADSVPRQVVLELHEAGVAVETGADPCLLPKARKTPAEIAGARAAHLRDGAAMVEFLAWCDEALPGGHQTEIDVVRRLEAFRAATGALREIAFDTICGAGPNGAIVHYRVTTATNRKIHPGDVVLVDSGGQYADGTTDITRTLATGPVAPEVRDAYTRVLRGLIALSRARWPAGLAGRDLDALARYPLWLSGRDYDHGTGHGVGAYLCVHEGPQRFSRLSDVPLEPGMILSNEPGHYREGAYGIRLENLVLVASAPALPGGDPGRAMLELSTLTLVPFDLRLVDRAALSAEEIAWLDAYHARVLAEVGPQVSDSARAWLARACRPLAGTA
ncbi:aminopeptidase P family protein [Phaeovulum vinaykumarii]|uniref:Xaa-Pro aminopeptidase n=1 Tax=Phaeovulum vinaykumarii TaxID=407234 RepID=A0A1N7M2G0_9RHOB|nr:aminopeptidase P family protein [Phaeovulum vinaykumarii]SIS80267.1 Xaa-Pro aminopeptidase [Phaeovulum vinaykumarii]SOC09315.1 Xaa-Pro aminopeptidase [Phaeovulum vinaykumarii]